MSYECEYCNSVLQSARTLKKHQRTAKKCIEKRGVGYEIKCICEKEFSRADKYKKHTLQCVPFIQDKYTKMIEEKDKLIDEKEKKIKEEKEIAIKEKDKVINKLEKEIKKLNKRATTINNNKITINNPLINLNIPANLSQTAIQEICKQFLNQKTVNEGYKSMAKFLVKYIIMDKDGKVNVLCTDVNRKVFKYRDEDGRLLKDVRGFILKKKIRKGSIQEINKIAGGLLGNLDPENDTFIIEADRINSSRDYEKLVKELSVLLYEKSLTVDDLKKELPPPKIEEKKQLIENEDSDDEEIVKQYWTGDEEEEILDEETMKEINEKVHDFYTREIHEIGKKCDDNENSKSPSPQKKVLSKKNKKDEKDDEVLVIKLKEWKEEKSIEEENEEENENEEEEMTNEERVEITSKLMGWSSLPLTKEDKIKLKKFYNEKSIKEQIDIEYPSNQESEDDRTPRTKKRLQKELEEDNGPYGYGPIQISYDSNDWN